MNQRPMHLLALHRLIAPGFMRPALLGGWLLAGASGWAEPASDEGAELDWVPAEALSEIERRALPQGCCGAYRAPPREEGEDAEAQMAPEQAPVRLSGERVRALGQRHYEFEGEVRLRQGYRSLNAEHAEYDRETGRASAGGDIELREPGVLVRGERAEARLESGNAEVEQARFVLYETRVRGRAHQLEKLGDHFIGLSDSALTTCEPGSRAWLLESENIDIHRDKHYGTAQHARLRVRGVPVFYTPYLRFPVGEQRQSGFLFPSLTDSSRNGVELTVPFYWNIAPNMDATITPEYLSERGTHLRLQTRHLSRYFETRLSGGYLNKDRGREADTYREPGEPEPEVNPYLGESRWQYRLLQHGGRDRRWSTQIDYTDLSDRDYLRDFNSGGLDVNRTAVVAKHLAGHYQGDHWLLGAEAEELRALSTGRWPYRELPRTYADGRYRWGDWVLALDNEYARFDVNATFEPGNPEFIENMLTGERFRTDYRLSWEKDWAWGFFEPTAMVKSLSYRFDRGNLVEGANPDPTLVVPQGTVDTGLFFERDTGLFGTTFLQTLEPRLFYFYSDYQDHSDLFGLTANNRPVAFDAKRLTFGYDQLFRTERFVGHDRIGDANQLSVALTSRLIDPLSGIERFSASIGQIFYFDDRRVSLSAPYPEDNPEALPPEQTYDRSVLASRVRARLTDTLSLGAEATYQEFESRLDTANASVRYQDGENRLINLAYRYTHRPPSPGFEHPDQEQERAVDQVDASFYWPLVDQWHLVGRSNYDFTYGKELDTFVGLEYDDCCYRVRLLARRWLDFDFTPNFLEQVESDDYDQSIILDIQFKGLGSINRKVGELLEKAIPGYGVRDGSIR